MSEVKVNKISPRTNCGTVTLGDSGDSFTIPSGVTITNNGTQTGFGRTGTVNWNTTKITADPGNAVSGVGYFTDTSSSAFNVTLPSSPSAGDIVAVADYANTWDTNNLTVARNGSNIEGAASDFACNQEGASVTFVYVDATKGWIVVNSGNSSQASAASFVSATGGTITTSGDFKIHTFTGPGTFTVCDSGNALGSNTVSYVVVAGGGAGGRGASDSGNAAGGGGGGGFRESRAAGDSYTASPLNATSGPTYNLPVSAQAYPITVGGGGPTPPFPQPSNTNSPAANGNGSNSIFSTITSTGGGGGGNRSGATPQGGAPGGSGGGSVSTSTAGSGNTPPVSPPQGNPGATATPGTTNSGTGGGGASAAGGKNPGSSELGGAGGAGVTTEITASPVAYAGGGGGGGSTNNGNSPGPGTGGSPGTGGGGGGAGDDSSNATAGTTNRGGGGGGGSGSDPGSAGANGGSGIVIIRYKYQ